MISLSALINDKSILIAPGVYDALSTTIAEKAGAKCLYLSGASIAYTRFASPDIGLVTMSEVNDTLSLITDKTELPVIVDADNGFGNALNMQRTMRVFERSGASALQIEDQSFPKRCGHLAGKSLISKDEMMGKIKAAVDARQNEETLIIARTDARSVEGLDQAFERAESYIEAGADVLFIEAPETIEEMQAITSRFSDRIPLLANMVEGGKTPVKNASVLEAMGFAIVIFPGGLVRAISHHMQAYFSNLLAEGSNAKFTDHMHDFKGLNDIIGTDDMLELGKRYE
ncbi:MAG: oxaloacetate decarboxylase [Proteobacteria bacterium]|jgi:2-methylisocitrate lyase-like PEP mutase family enzyme|nr:oxaloacetate decarboxylase [Pseudomonadota bacterium]MDA0908781.1 oxaloacetate decarboxylase [Pseudomonadota bacterium]